MYSISRLQQIIKPIMHGRFQHHIRKYQADKHSKGFGCHNLLVSMIYAHLSHSNSLRTLEQSFNANSHHHYHLNVRSIRSTLSEALAKRNTRPFADMLAELMRTCSRTLRKPTQETADLLYLIDSTPIALKGRGFDQWVSNNGRISGLKIHILMNHANNCPIAQSITEATVNDIDQHHLVQPEKGATYIFDKGYCDYNWWAELDNAGAYFVTRLKTNAAVQVVERIMPSENPNTNENTHKNTNATATILADEYIRFKHKKNSSRPNHYHGKTLRRITVKREDKAPLVLVSNNLTAPAQEIADTYKQRWQIELLFKWLKQHLQLKRFFGRNANAVKLQLLCAMMAYLLLKLYQQSTRTYDSLHLLYARIAGCLFERPQTLYTCYAQRKREREVWMEAQERLI